MLSASIGQKGSHLVTKQLGDGLILRSISEGHASDAKNLADFYLSIFKETDTDVSFGYWTGDLLSGHPTVTGDDIWVVVDPAKNDEIVSALLLIPQVWKYDGIDIPVGRVELVATNKDYRRRGLVRDLMDILHERSEQSGHVLQAITGIPYFYRQFGYAMAVTLGEGARVFLSTIKPPQDNQPPYTLRLATSSDIPDLIRWGNWYAKDTLLRVVRTTEQWEYELSGRNPKATFKLEILIIENAEGIGVGYLAIDATYFLGRISCYGYVVGEESSYLDTFESVIIGLADHVKTHHPDKNIEYVRFDSGVSQAINLLTEHTGSAYNLNAQYAWYVRVSDLARLLNHIKPVLEERLRGSVANAYTGKLMIDLYERDGLCIEFEQGAIKDVYLMKRHDDAFKPDCAFPFHSLLSLIFGHHTQREVADILPDAWTGRRANVLLHALFPKKRSWLMPFA